MTEPILVDIATALATRAATTLYDLVKKKFSKDPEATKALEAAQATPEAPEPVNALADRLAAAEQSDPTFAHALRTTYTHHAETGHTETGGVVNQITGPVTGKAIQARDIHGNITL